MILALFMMLSLAGCQKEEASDGEYQVFYMNMDRTKIVPEGYDSTGAKGEELLFELIERLKTAPQSAQLRPTIPSNVKVKDIVGNGAYVYVDFSKEYMDLTPTEEVLVRAAVVRTILQTGEYSLITFTVESEPLRSKDGTLVGTMTMDSFVENPGEQINSSVQTTLKLYFSNADGTKLVEENREVHYSTNISMEKLIMEQLIEGPKTAGAKATIPSETRIITVSVIEGVCFISLDDGFKNQNQEITEDVVLYSIVNSITELPGVTRVQLSINGDTSQMVRYTYELSKLYEKNMDLLKVEETQTEEK